MRRVSASVFAVLATLSLLWGCALMPEDPVEAAPVAAAPVAVAPLAQADMPAPRSTPLVSGAISKPAVYDATGKGARPAVLNSRRHAQTSTLPVKFVEQAVAAGIGMGPAPSRATASASREATAKAQPGPAWLKACRHRQQQGDVIMCDADSLLAPPSDKVMVYVREAKLSGAQPSGQRIALRESLPRLYRIFVLD